MTVNDSPISTAALLFTLGVVAAIPGTAASQQKAAGVDARLKSLVQPFVENWCGECHSGDEPEASLHLPELFRRMPTKDEMGVYVEIRDVLKLHEMPPEDEPAPSDAERAKIVSWLNEVLASGKKAADPGRVTMRRLSRFEYQSTVRDLFGIEHRMMEEITRAFPADDLGYGFDNIGGALSVSSLHLENYAAAAKRITEFAVYAKDEARSPREFGAGDFKLRGRVVPRGEAVVFSSRGTVEVPVHLPRDGDYIVKVRAFGQQAGDEPARMALLLDGEKRHTFDVPNERDKPRTFEHGLRIPGGSRRIAIAFVNDYYKRDHPNRKRRDRNLWVTSIVVTGPIDEREIPASHRWIFGDDDGSGSAAKRARPMLARVLPRAWRRPLQPGEIDRSCEMVAAAVRAGDTFEQALRLAIQAALVSPHFLFRIEPAAIGKQTDGHPGKGHPGKDQPAKGTENASAHELLGPYEIASRLSYFLWSSLPDEVLMRRAAADELRDPEVLTAETRRMLADPRADALAENFAAQWLELRSLDEHSPDPKRFETYSASLRDAMRRETTLFFRAVLRETRSAFELIDADFTFLNEELARHYEIEGVEGPELRRVSLRDRRRGGLLGHASIQTVTSNPTRTSPVKRGKWILENILDDPPPPPEPGFDSFPNGKDLTVAATMRAELAQHRKAKACAVCHNRMDALGLAMENFDAIGRWRDKDHGQRIDATGELPGGRKLDGPLDLKTVLVTDRAFVRCLAKKLFLFGVGREVRGQDKVVLDQLVESLGPRPTIADIIVKIVGLDAFRLRTVAR